MRMQRKLFVAIFLSAAIFGLVFTDDDYSSEEDSSEEVFRPRDPHRRFRGPRRCTSDNDCDYDRCCLPTAYGDVCVEKGDEVGEACGGMYNCLTCRGPWLQCVANPELGTTVDRERVTGRCQRRYVTDQFVPRGTIPQEPIPDQTVPQEPIPEQTMPPYPTGGSFDDVYISNTVV